MGPTHPDTLASMLAYVALIREVYPAADLFESVDSKDGERTCADAVQSLNNFAMTLKAMSRFEDADTLYRHALRKSKQGLGSTHPSTLIIFNNLAVLLQAM